MVFADDFETFFSAIGTTDFEPTAAEDQPNQVYHFLFVFNTEDHLCAYFGHALPPERIKFTTNNTLLSFHTIPVLRELAWAGELSPILQGFPKTPHPFCFTDFG
jgi:hypothetical protein